MYCKDHWHVCVKEINVFKKLLLPELRQNQFNKQKLLENSNGIPN